MSENPVGVLGGYGDVGAHTARLLHRAGAGPLLIGGRDRARAEQLMETNLDGTARAVFVDIADERSLLDFAGACRVIVNTAGPSCQIGQPVARAARTVGTDLVDVAGDEPLHAFLIDMSETSPAEPDRIDLLSAGMQPGLTGILPRLLASTLDHVESLEAWFAVVDHFTEAAAEDYLEGTALRLTEPLAAWRNGHRASQVMRRSSDPVSIPGIDGHFGDLPVLTTEGERLAIDLGLTDGVWHTLLADGQVSGVLDRLHSLDRVKARETLCLASTLDMASRKPAAALLAEVRSSTAGGSPPQIRSGLLHGPGTGVLAGAAAAAATLAVLGGEVTPGLHYAAQILDPARTLDRVCTDAAIELHVVDGPTALIDPFDEGAL